MKEPSEYTRNLLVKLETKSKPPANSAQNFQATYGSKASYNQMKAPVVTQKFLSKPSYDKPLTAQREPSRELSIRGGESSLMSGSSSSSQLLKTDMARKVMLEYKELQIRHKALEEDHTKIKEKYEKLLHKSKKMSALLKDRRLPEKPVDMMNISTEENRDSEHRGVSDLCDLSEIPNVENISENSRALLSSPTTPVPQPAYTDRTQRTSKESQTAQNWRLQVALRDKQRLQVDNNFLRRELQDIRRKMDTYLVTNNNYSVELETANTELKGQLEHLRELYTSETRKIEQIREIVAGNTSQGASAAVQQKHFLEVSQDRTG